MLMVKYLKCLFAVESTKTGKERRLHNACTPTGPESGFTTYNYHSTPKCRVRCFFTAPADLFFSEGNKVNYNIDNFFFFCSEDDDIFNDYGEEMDLRPLTQEELRSAIINKVTRKSTCQRLYIRHARSTRLQWGPKNLMFYSTINLQLVELQNFRKIFCSV